MRTNFKGRKVYLGLLFWKFQLTPALDLLLQGLCRGRREKPSPCGSKASHLTLAGSDRVEEGGLGAHLVTFLQLDLRRVYYLLHTRTKAATHRLSGGGILRIRTRANISKFIFEQWRLESPLKKEGERRVTAA